MIGETKLGYKITELVGQGGFGTVYKAVKKTKAMESVRALKHISLPSRKQWTDIYNSMGNDVARTDEYFDGILQEILNEIRILADLTKKGVKNVVWYYENEIEDTPSPKHYDIYLLMEFLTSLPSYIETHELKVRDVIKIGTDILSALVECHKSKIIHRDIKTDNIFISEDGDYKLGDFGVSKKLSDKSRATSMKGTPNFIAPEVYLGQEYDETVDLYSLGIVLYRLLNYNRNPFMPSYPTSYNSEDEDRAFELRMKGDVPEYPAFANNELGDIILKSISNRENRYESASEFKSELEKVLKTIGDKELDKVVLENVLSGVDFSSFGSKNDKTQMAVDSMDNVSNRSYHSSQQNSISTNQYNNSINANDSAKKNKFIIPAVIACVLILGGAGMLLFTKGKNENNSISSNNNVFVDGGKFVQIDGYTKFVKKNGEYAQNEWVLYDGKEYYFDVKQSLIVDGEVNYNGKTYFVDNDGAKIINDWYKSSSGKEYYLDSSGEPFKSTGKTINGEVYFFNEKGEKVVNDWFLYDGDYYYLDSSGKMLKNSTKDVSATERYYLDGNGKMLKNSFYDFGGNTFYYGDDGKMKINELFIVDSALYFAQNGGMIKKDGWCNNNLYYADSEGKILINTTTPDGVQVDNTGKRIQTTNNNNNLNNTNTSKQNTQKSGVTKATGQSSLPENGNNNVKWGNHLRHSDSVYLDEYGEDGIGKINIDVTRLIEDGSSEVNVINSTLEEIFNAACDRADFELPYKHFELDKTSLSTCNSSTVIIVVAGKIQYTDDSEENIRYRLTLNRTTGSATYEKVR